jgi:hypothetical protein
MSKIISGGRKGRSTHRFVASSIGGLGVAFVLAGPSAALAQGMLCPVLFQVTSSETLGALQITADYATAAALGDMVSCSVLPSGASDTLLDAAGNKTTIGYANDTGFSGPAGFASCLFKTVGDTAPVAGDFAVAIDDAADTDVPPNTETPTVVASVGTCVPSGSCEYTPLSGCKVPTTVGKAKFLFKNNADDTKDQAQFQWKFGAATMVSEFSDPVTAGKTWSWCTYLNGTLVHGSDVASGILGWKATGTTGFMFKGDVEGVSQIKVKAGVDGKAQALVKAKSKVGNFSSPTLPLTGAVVGQLVIDNGMTTTCFQSTAGTPKKNDALQFQAAGNP